MPNATETYELVSLPDNTNLIACSSNLIEFHSDVLNTNARLISNKLSLNTIKTTLINFELLKSIDLLNISNDLRKFCRQLVN